MERRPLKQAKRLVVVGGIALSAAFTRPAWVSSADIPQAPEPTPITQEMEHQTESTYLGIDLMKMTKDRVRNPLPPEEMDMVMARSAALGITHVAIDTPYDLTSDGIDPIEQTRQWVAAARKHNISVSHRHMFNEAEGTYDVPQNNSPEFQDEMITRMVRWMVDNQDLIQDGDTWTPMPEPQNLGVNGMNWCGPNGDECLFQSVEEFNVFIQKAVIASRRTLEELGKKVKVICCGYDGYTAVGDNNPNRELNENNNTFLYPETIEAMENTYAVDHYPQPDYQTGIRRTYGHFLNLAAKTLPDAQLILTEVGHEGYDDEESIASMFNSFKEAIERNELRGVWFWFNSEEQFWDEKIFQELKAGIASLPSEVASHR